MGEQLRHKASEGTNLVGQSLGEGTQGTKQAAEEHELKQPTAQLNQYSTTEWKNRIVYSQKMSPPPPGCPVILIKSKPRADNFIIHYKRVKP